MHYRQLQHSGALPFAELRHQHVASIREFDRIVMSMRNMRIDCAKFSDPETD
jgi:hypothetical protein